MTIGLSYRLKINHPFREFFIGGVKERPHQKGRTLALLKGQSPSLFPLINFPFLAWLPACSLFLCTRLTPLNRGAEPLMSLPPPHSDATMDLIQSKHALLQDPLPHHTLLTSQRQHKRGRYLPSPLTHKALCYFLVGSRLSPHCFLVGIRFLISTASLPSYFSLTYKPPLAPSCLISDGWSILPGFQ